MINKNQIHLSLSFELKDNPINSGMSLQKFLLFQTLVTIKNNSIKRNTPL